MCESTLRRLDLFSRAVLLIWCALALVVTPSFFQPLTSRTWMGLGVGRVISGMDIAAWLAFGLAFLTTAASRWFADITDPDVIGPMRLWTATALAALLICMASTFIVTPRLESGLVDKAYGIFRQMFFLRLLLALGLAAGIRYLPASPIPPSGEDLEVPVSDREANS
jgi:hypothetical protein